MSTARSGSSFSVPSNRVANLRAALGSWSGLGLVVAGIARQGWDLQLTGYGEGYWRAPFYVTGMEHS